MPSPAVHDLVTVDGRLGLVFDRADGPWALNWPAEATITARLQAEIHDLVAPEICHGWSTRWPTSASMGSPTVIGSSTVSYIPETSSLFADELRSRWIRE